MQSRHSRRTEHRRLAIEGAGQQRTTAGIAVEGRFGHHRISTLKEGFMGTFSIWHWLIVLIVVLVMFGGKGKISQIMGDVGNGLKAFKKSLRDDDRNDDVVAEPKALRASSDPTVAEAVRERDHAAKS
jgi:sec-independent protein translocase protein TatA